MWPLVVTPLTVEIETVTGGYVVVGVADGAGDGAVDGAFDEMLDPDGTSLGVLLGKAPPGVDDVVGTPDGTLEGRISDEELGTAGKGVDDVENVKLPVEDEKREDDGATEEEGVTATLRVLLDSVKVSWAGSGDGGTLAP